VETAVSANANTRTAADVEPVVAVSIDEATGRTDIASAVVGSGEPAAPPAAAAAEAGDAAVGGVVGPSAAALAVWESVGMMLSEDDHLGAEGNSDGGPSVLFASSASESSTDGQSSDARGSEGEASDGCSTELSQGAQLPGERSLEELGATLLYEKVLTANDVKSSVALPEVRPAETGICVCTRLHDSANQERLCDVLLSHPKACVRRMRTMTNPQPCISTCRH